MHEAHSLPKRIKTIWAISAIMNGLFLIVLSILALIFFHLFGHNFLFWIFIILMIAGILVFAGQMLLIPYRYHFWTYEINEQAVEINYGFIFRQRVGIPIIRVQDVELEAGPLLQWQKLQKVNISTASTDHTIDGLEIADAQKLREQIVTLVSEAKEHAI
ncbi:PH domain-containing protein [Oenococcus alcoholitolerans]|uniref:YdbS-like PH domain-containing protein n=1 Tax=Oenococcus alcoholitolerans TaxID=931074 RepID=A0ABR4XR77_9LACO|nr:hypothetical protein Q757_03785 [Oenococcus alcoholitolerans]